MSDLKSTLLGFGAALIIGAGGGLAVTSLSSAEAEVIEEPMALPAMSARLVVEDIKGTAKVLTPSGAWRLAKLRDALERPSGLKTEGLDSSITVSLAGTRLVLKHDARLLLSASGALALTLDSGQLLLRSSSPVRVAIPANQGVVTGEAFGVWARRGSLYVAVLDGQATVDTPALSTKYAKGREIVINAGGALPSVLEPQLVLEAAKIERAGAGYAVSGRTAPNAIVLLKKGRVYEELAVSAGGTFIASIAGSAPAPGELQAHDAVGRRAELGRPSESLEQILASLASGAVVPESTKTAPPEAAREEEAPAAPAPPEPVKAEPKKAEPRKAEPVEPRAAKEPRAKEERPTKRKAPKKEPGEPAGGEPVSEPLDLKPPATVGEPPPPPPKEEPRKEEKQDSVELEWGAN